MRDIIANPDELEEFARHLGTFAQQTREGLERLNSELHEMGMSSWRDARYQEYQLLHEEVQAQVNQSLEVIESEHITYLRSLAERLRAYL